MKNTEQLVKTVINDIKAKSSTEQNNNSNPKDEREYVDVLLKIIQDYLPIIYKHNIHLHDNIRSAIELVLDQSAAMNPVQMNITEETIKDVDEIITLIQEEG